MKFHLSVSVEDGGDRSPGEGDGPASVIPGDSHKEMLASVANIGKVLVGTRLVGARRQDAAAGIVPEVI